MPTTAVIVSIVVLLAALVCYAFISQTLRNKRERKNRLLAALRARNRTFKFMLSGFPTGFLPKELTLLVHRSLTDVLEQLVKLDPDEPAHLQDLQVVSNQMAEIQKKARPQQAVQLENAQQIKEVKMCLEELHRFIFSLEKRNIVNGNQAESYRNQIKQLVLQVTINSYENTGKVSMQAGKTKLAVHYFETALNLVVREGKAGQFDKKIAELKVYIEEAKDQLAAEVPSKPTAKEMEGQEEISEEWDKFAEDNSDSTWKKKHVYD